MGLFTAPHTKLIGASTKSFGVQAIALNDDGSVAFIEVASKPVVIDVHTRVESALLTSDRYSITVGESWTSVPLGSGRTKYTLASLAEQLGGAEDVLNDLAVGETVSYRLDIALLPSTVPMSVLVAGNSDADIPFLPGTSWSVNSKAAVSVAGGDVTLG